MAPNKREQEEATRHTILSLLDEIEELLSGVKSQYTTEDSDDKRK